MHKSSLSSAKMSIPSSHRSIEKSKIFPDIRRVNVHHSIDASSERFIVPSLKDRIPLFENPKITNTLIDYTKNTLKRYISHKKMLNHSEISPIFVSQLKVPDMFQFHNKIVKTIQKKYLDRTNSVDISVSNFDEMLNEEGNNVNNNNIRSLFYKKSNESKSTQNIFDVCRKKCEEKKIEMHFIKKRVPQPIKEILVKEVLDARQKKNYKYSQINKKTKPQMSLCLQKLKHYFYISKQNPVLEINKEGKLPNIIDDGALMNKLLVDGFKQIDISNRPVYL